MVGPPCGGKSTYVREHAKSDDLVVDFDSIIRSLGNGPGGHDHPERLKTFAFAARDAVMLRLERGGHDVDNAWIINSGATLRDRRGFVHLRPRVILVTADARVLRRRAYAERPPAWLGYIDRWMIEFDDREIDDTVITG